VIATAPTVIQDIGTWGLAVAALAAIGGIMARALRHVIHDEVPRAMQQAVPEVTRALVHDEVDRALEPFAAQLHEEIRKTREEMKPNGGSTFRDEVDRRFNMMQAQLEEIRSEGE